MAYRRFLQNSGCNPRRIATRAVDLTSVFGQTSARSVSKDIEIRIAKRTLQNSGLTGNVWLSYTFIIFLWNSVVVQAAVQIEAGLARPRI